MPESNVIIPLDSYRLAQYTAQVPCYICSGPNTFDAELCRHCYAPMALTHQANTQHVLPQMIATIGADRRRQNGLSRHAHRHAFAARRTPANSRRGAFSISLQQNTVKALSRCEFPQKTPNEPDRWHWVHCQVRMKQRKRPLELIMPDMAGETILHETDHPNSYPVIRSLLLQCAGVIVLVDAARIAEGQSDQDFFTMKLLSYLMELDSDRKRGWPNRPVAVIFSKSDQCEECFNDPAGFARKQAPGVWQQCQERFQTTQVFRVGRGGGLHVATGVRRGRRRACRCASNRAASSNHSAG